VTVIADSFYSDANSNRKDNTYLRNWVGCSFSGDETFELVAQKLRVKFTRIGDYLNYILKLPQMNNLIHIKNGKYQKGIMISLQMSLDCFSRLVCESNNTYPQPMDEDNVGTTHSTTDREEDKYVLEAWKKTFYNVYSTKFEGMKNTTLIDQARYNFIVSTLQSIAAYPSDTKLTAQEKRFKNKYILLSNVKNRCLNRRGTSGEWLLVPTYEEIFNILKFHHTSLSHIKDFRKNKDEVDKTWYSIPESCIKIFLNLCPICYSGSNPARSSKQNPLKFIYSPRVGHRAQIDLIGMETQSCRGYQHILRYVDHLSGFSYVAPLKSKVAKHIGMKLIKIFSTSIIPEILQSDNGSEFLGECIDLIKKYYPNVHIVKGRPRHPQSQGKIERSHATFKNALQKWMKSSGNNNWLIGCYIVNAELNQVSQYNRGGFSPYNLYYGINGTQKTIINFGEVASKYCHTEYGVLCARELCTKANRINNSKQVTEEQIIVAMKRGKYIVGTYLFIIMCLTFLLCR